MSRTKQALAYALIIQGLTAANKGCVFWNKSDAMKALNMFNTNQQRGT